MSATTLNFVMVSCLSVTRVFVVVPIRSFLHALVADAAILCFQKIEGIDGASESDEETLGVVAAATDQKKLKLTRS